MMHTSILNMYYFIIMRALTNLRDNDNVLYRIYFTYV